jgi:hypothetical protein
MRTATDIFYQFEKMVSGNPVSKSVQDYLLFTHGDYSTIWRSVDVFAPWSSHHLS